MSSMNPLNAGVAESLAQKEMAANAALEKRVAESNRILAAKQDDMLRRSQAIRDRAEPLPSDVSRGVDRFPGLTGQSRRDARKQEFYDKIGAAKAAKANGYATPLPPAPPGLAVLKPNQKTQIWRGANKGAGGGKGGGRR